MFNSPRESDILYQMTLKHADLYCPTTSCFRGNLPCKVDTLIVSKLKDI